MKARRVVAAVDLPTAGIGRTYAGRDVKMTDDALHNDACSDIRSIILSRSRSIVYDPTRFGIRSRSIVSIILSPVTVVPFLLDCRELLQFLPLPLDAALHFRRDLGR